MFNNYGGYSLADVAAATGNNNNNCNDGFGNCSWWIIVLFLFAFMNNGWNNRNGYNDGAVTRADLCADMNFQEMANGIRGISSGLCDGFYAQLSNYAAMQRQLCDEFGRTNQNIQQARFDAQQCCCETNRNIDSVKYENSQNTCRIENAIREQGESIKALINQNTMQELRDRLEARDRDLLAAQFQISQIGQTSALVNELRPCAKPAYITCSPYVTNSCGNGYNNGCGGCNC